MKYYYQEQTQYVENSLYAENGEGIYAGEKVYQQDKKKIIFQRCLLAFISFSAWIFFFCVMLDGFGKADATTVPHARVFHYALTFAFILFTVFIAMTNHLLYKLHKKQKSNKRM